ncbi:MAG: PAS domain S-box protein [Armatimonadetes bacterium]|nr:PAS domain S-box protein [Armatimonadota bacterium]
MLTAIRTGKIKGLEAGADVFLTKPLEPNELSAQINVMLRIKEAEDNLRAEKVNLEELVLERTKELQTANEMLKQDITERKQAEEELISREKFLDHIIDQSPFATWISDAKGTMQRTNPALKKMMNLTDDQLLGKYNVLEDKIAERAGIMPLVHTVFEEGM